MASINELIAKADEIQQQILNLECAKAQAILDFDAKIAEVKESARPAYEMLCGLRGQCAENDFSQFERASAEAVAAA